MPSRWKIFDSRKGRCLVSPDQLNNGVCAYRDCTEFSSVRMKFPLGFSALFCPECATKLQKENIATPIADIGIETSNKIDGYSTPASIESSSNRKVIEHG